MAATQSSPAPTFMGWRPPSMSMTASRRCPRAARGAIQIPEASGPRQAMVLVMASSVSCSAVRSRSKSTHPVIPHMSAPLPSDARLFHLPCRRHSVVKMTVGLFEERFDVLRRLRTGEEVALGDVAAKLAEMAEVVGRLHPFGHDHQPQGVG